MFSHSSMAAPRSGRSAPEFVRSTRFGPHTRLESYPVFTPRTRGQRCTPEMGCVVTTIAAPSTVPGLSSSFHDDGAPTGGKRSIPLDRMASRDCRDDRLGVNVLRLSGASARLGARSRMVEDRALLRVHSLAPGIGVARTGRGPPHRSWSRTRDLHRRRGDGRSASRCTVRRHRVVAILLRLDRARRRNVEHVVRSLLRDAGARNRRAGPTGDHHRRHRRRVRGHRRVSERPPAGRGVRLAKCRPGVCRRGGRHRRATHPACVPRRGGSGRDARPEAEPQRDSGRLR